MPRIALILAIALAGCVPSRAPTPPEAVAAARTAASAGEIAVAAYGSQRCNNALCQAKVAELVELFNDIKRLIDEHAAPLAEEIP
jgi:hypothetical protein